jgi:hypothetical protein
VTARTVEGLDRSLFLDQRCHDVRPGAQLESGDVWPRIDGVGDVDYADVAGSVQERYVDVGFLRYLGQ